MTAITRYRGDTKPFKFVRTVDGEVVDITDRTYKLTVSSLQNPSAAEAVGAQIFQVNGVITDAAAGEFEFRPTAEQTDVDPGKYYFDVEETDEDDYIETIEKDKMTFKQDITKGA